MNTIRIKSLMKHMFLFSITASFICTASIANAVSIGWGEPSPIERTAAVVLLPDKNLKRDYSKTPIPLQIKLEVVTTPEKASLATQPKDQPLKIGFSREVPLAYQGDLYSQLQWEAVPDGQVATLEITSPNARAVRLALQLNGLPTNAEIRFFGTKNTEVFGPVVIPTDSPLWSPVIAGDTARVEIYLPSSVNSNLVAFQIKLIGIQHLVYSPQYPQEKDLADIGTAGSCNIDVKCSNTSPSDLSAAVAKIIYSDSQYSYLCTGTLLNDADSSTSIPYFMTANHCISLQATASTIDS